MSPEKFESIIADENAQNAYKHLTEIGDELVARKVKNDDAFWVEIDSEVRSLFSTVCVIHLAGDNGIEAVLRRFPGSAFAIFRCAALVFNEIGGVKFYEAIERFLFLVRSELNLRSIKIPTCVVPEERNAYILAERSFYNYRVMKLIRGEVRSLDDALIGCFNSILPFRVLEWIWVRKATLGQVLCS